MRLGLILFGTLFLLCRPGMAEYRAFLLKITGPPPKSPPAAEAPPPATPLAPNFRLVKSNLDSEQYPGYYPLLPGETIYGLETWMCRGRTGDFLPVCDNPNTPRTPASTPTEPPK